MKPKSAVNVLVSPSEPSSVPKLMEKLGMYAVSSDLPEARGADYLLYSDKGALGFQRKEVPYDFLTSVADGRLTRELSLLSTCAFRWVIGEGEFKFFKDGTLAVPPVVGQNKVDWTKAFKRFTRTAIRKIIAEIDLVKGVTFTKSEDLEDTCRLMRDLFDFVSASTHYGLSRRPGMPKEWGIEDDEELNLWILQGFGGVGPATAKNILNHFGQLPLGWTCTYEELCAVPGLTARTAERLWKKLYS